MAENPPLVDLQRLVADHHAVLFRYAYRLTGSTADAEDLTQQTYLQAQSRLDQIRSAECARGWLFAVLRNAYLKSLRKPVPQPVANLELSLENIPDELPPESLVDPEQLQQALDGLPAEFKTVVLMFYFEHCSYREIAERLSLPLGTVMSRLSRAKGHLRSHLFPVAEPATPSPPTRNVKPARIS